MPCRLFALLLCTTAVCHEEIPKLLLISFDGFRHDYIEKYNLVAFRRFAEEGARAKRMQSCFTTVTLPNHFSLVTGLYEDRHGIVSNQMFDSATNATFDMYNADKADEWWTQNPNALPIWTANQLSGDANRSSGTVCWASATCPFRGILPDKHIDCHKLKSFTHTIDTVFEWFTDPISPINFAAVYFDEPDKTGHEHGPHSAQTEAMLDKLSTVLEDINENIRKSKMTKVLNVVIVSDHGMMKVDPNRSVILEDYLDKTTYDSYGTSTVKSIFPKSKEFAFDIYRNLSGIQGCKVYSREQLKRFHYSNNSRIGPIVLVADPGYLLFKTEFGRRNSTLKGNHGYHNFVDEMYSIFLARGPSFRPNSSVESIKVVDVFPLLIELLKLDRKLVSKISQINEFDKGSLYATLPLLSYVPDDYDSRSVRSASVIGVLIGMVATLLVALIATAGIIRTGWNVCFSTRWLQRHCSSREDSALL